MADCGHRTGPTVKAEVTLAREEPKEERANGRQPLPGRRKAVVEAFEDVMALVTLMSEVKSEVDAAVLDF